MTDEADVDEMVEDFDRLRNAPANMTDDDFDVAADGWLRTEAAATYDALKADPSRDIPAEVVRAEFKAMWAAR
ncbi:hypothetical protein [Nocardioides halotolerans]|uniref:hypothetical protein n=1 Tax=Nocardioides halotolerans TaxID=433660 RepID=UPI0005624963|nr:hypothetical protein [Nocardioides halotolerans]